MDITEIAEKFAKAKGIVITWFSVLTRGPGAFRQIELEKSSTLFYALKFMLYMAFVDFLLHIPSAAAKGGIKDMFIIEPLLLVETYLEYLATGLILYGSMKLFGGKGSLQACIAAYCFLTAYLPVVSVLMLPLQMFVFPGIARGNQIPQIVRSASAKLSQSSIWERSGFLLSFLLTTVVFVVFFVAVFRTFRMIHELKWARAVFAFVLGLVCSAVILAFFLEPFLTTILQAAQSGHAALWEPALGN
jgi:hypothetical protein